MLFEEGILNPKIKSKLEISESRISSVSYADIVLSIISILVRMASIVLNLLMAHDYYIRGKFNYFAWTVLCIIVPMIVTTLICIAMYISDIRGLNRKRYGILEFIWLVLILPCLCRYYQSLVYAVKCKCAEKRRDSATQKKFFELMIQEESDVTLLRIFECFLEAVPQKILQISIILNGQQEITRIQIAAVSGCLISMTWCIVIYNKYNRFSQPDKEKISKYGIVLQCLWYFFISVSRVASIAMACSVQPLWTICGCFIHVLCFGLAMLIFDTPKFCTENCFGNSIFTLVLAFVFIFIYINPKDGPTRNKFCIYYTICIIENVLCLALYLIFTLNENRKTDFNVLLCIFALLSYFIGIFYMVLYYKKCHPNVTSRNYEF